ncbi:MAG TPA: class I SAM-dependent methyltransferase [Acidimicrobiia bacterium]
MSADNVFDTAELATGYATQRPPIHAVIIERARPRLGFGERVDLAVDVGCGAGSSMRPVLSLARRCVGVDPSPSMIHRAVAVVPEASFVVGRAESLPLRARAAQLITAAGSLNFVDLAAFYEEVRRVLTPDGVLLVYDFGAGRSSKATESLDQWYSELLARWPAPRDGRHAVDPEVLAQGPLDVRAFERLTVDVELSLDAYVGYVMTQTNISSAIRSGTPESAIRSWCEATLRPIFTTTRYVEFPAYYACLTA